VHEGGFFGQILWLMRERHSEPALFSGTLQAVVTQLEKMPDAERTRWMQFLSYIWALVYHARSTDERPKLNEVVERSVQTDPHRQEVMNMGQTIAEMYEERGLEKGILVGELASARTILLRQLRKRFKKVPRKVAARITATTNMRDLETWLDNIVDADTLAKVGIPLD